MKLQHVLALLVILLTICGCSGGSGTPVTPGETSDSYTATLNRAADALEKGDIDTCLKYFADPEKNGKALKRLKDQWPKLARAMKKAIVENQDKDLIRMKLRFERPDKPGEFIDLKIFLVKTDDGKWLLSPKPLKLRNGENRSVAWGTNTAHGTYLTRAILEYYLRNYPQDRDFTSAYGILKPNSLRYPVLAHHQGPVDTILGIYDVDIYENVPPDAWLVANAPTSLIQIGAIDEDVFLGEYDSGNNLVFNRDIRIDTSSGIKLVASDDWGSVDDTSFKGYAHFLTPFNQNYIQNSFIGFNDMSILGDQSSESAPADRWGLGMERIGPVSILDVIDMRENYNRKTWQYAIQQYKDATKEANPLIAGKKLGDSFYALGHVLHLLEDCGIPAHVRNDMHGIPGLSYIPGLEYLQPDPLEDWSDTFSSGLINKTVQSWNELFLEHNPIERFPNGFATNEPLLTYYYNNSQIPEYAGYDALFKSLAFLTNRSFFSEDTIHQSTQGYANTSQYPEITRWDFDYGGRTVIYGRAGLPGYYNVEHPLAISTLWFDTWVSGFWLLHWRYPTLEETISEMESDGDLFTLTDDYDDDYFTNGSVGVRETQYEVQFKRVVRHGAALIHEFYLETHK